MEQLQGSFQVLLNKTQLLSHRAVLGKQNSEIKILGLLITVTWSFRFSGSLSLLQPPFLLFPTYTHLLVLRLPMPLTSVSSFSLSEQLRVAQVLPCVVFPLHEIFRRPLRANIFPFSVPQSCPFLSLFFFLPHSFSFSNSPATACHCPIDS